MVDVVFLLIVFFILVSQFVRTERTPVALPALPADALEPLQLRERLVIHVERAAYRAGSDTIPANDAARAQLAARIASALNASPGAAVVIRAPRDAPYALVAPALEAARDARAQDVRLVAREVEP
jgi:biopolymer transport protein ExbD